MLDACGGKIRRLSFLWEIKAITRIVLLLISAFFCCIGYSETFITQDFRRAFADLPELDSRYQELLNRYLIESGVCNRVKANNHVDFATLLMQDGESFEVLCAIRNGFKHRSTEVLDGHLFAIVNYLYDNNDTATIQNLSNAIKSSGNPHQKATNYFLLGKYYFSRSNWKGVRAALSNINTKELVESDLHYYNVMMGFALQSLKEHRKSFNYYRQVPFNSPYYAQAKLNEGTAYLRQGWWTEAHIEISKAIDFLEKEKKRDAFLDRLYLVLGYSQLHYEFYRDARKTFRNISVESPYTNKALMGIGLSAAYQRDFKGAVNAFRILSQKVAGDLNVDEAKLLLPKAFEELERFREAEGAYRKAIIDYEAKIATLRQEIQNLSFTNKNVVEIKTRKLDKKALELYGEQQIVPEYFYKNYSAILAMQNTNVTSQTALKKEIDKLQERYETQLKLMISENLKLRLAITESYLSQAKFGMAKLYDR